MMTDFAKTNVSNLTRFAQTSPSEPTLAEALDEEGYTQDCLNRAVRAGLVEVKNGRIYATDKGERECSLA